MNIINDKYFKHRYTAYFIPIKFRICLTCILIILSTACKKFVQVDPPKNSLVTDAVFADSTTSTAALLGVYTGIMQLGTPEFLNGGLTIYMGMSADELIPTGTDNSELQWFSNGIDPMNNPSNSSIWTTAYQTIYRTNACLEGLSQSGGISNSLKAQLTGEARFIRCLSYYYLCNIYGGVPLITTTDYHYNATLSKQSLDSIYNFIVNELLQCGKELSLSYPSAGRVRTNRHASTALLTKIYILSKKWALAEKAASEVINQSTLYKLKADLKDVFLANSTESILEFLTVIPSSSTLEGILFVPDDSDIIPRYLISPNLLNAFEKKDMRYSTWIQMNTVDGLQYEYPFKYRSRNYSGSPIENFVVLRLADQYLLRAEARAHQGNLTGSNSAETDLNIIRRRSGLNDTTALVMDKMLSLILHERQIELFCEWGNRWIDLKRTGSVDSIMSVVTPNKGGVWNINRIINPIPYDEIKYNPFLKQNAGYN